MMLIFGAILCSVLATIYTSSLFLSLNYQIIDSFKNIMFYFPIEISYPHDTIFENIKNCQDTKNKRTKAIYCLVVKVKYDS